MQATETIPFTEPAVSAGTPLMPRVVRAVLFLWTVLIACPVRYWPLEPSVDNTWVFALNYAAAHGLAIGRDAVWTTGPLGYLVFPMDIGSNLSHALVFQGILWAVLIAIFADLFYRAGISLRNLFYFSLCFSLSAPLYWFNYMGPENLILAGMLILLVVAKSRGGLSRYVVALALAGVIPLIKLTGGMLAGGAVLGFLVDCIMRRGKQAWKEIALAPVIPVVAAGIGCWFLMPSLASLVGYVRASMEIVSGYSGAMSLQGDPIEFAGAAEVLIAMGAFLFIKARPDRRTAWFLVALLTVPILTSVKHGFIRQDIHVINFFCFAGLALGLISLVMPVRGARTQLAFLVLLNYGLVSMEYMYARVGPDALSEVAGVRGTSMALGALHFADTRASLKVDPRRFPPEVRIDPEMRAIVGDSPVASLSVIYTGAALDGLNLSLYPVIQRYSAYTPYLDRMNATWIREKGPRYLLYDGSAIDGRHPWVETPAMWLEVYRWYNTRVLRTGSVLLERRPVPRFDKLKSLGKADMLTTGQLDLLSSAEAVFWSMRCGTTPVGVFQKLLLRIPEVTMRLGSDPTQFRIIPEVMESPILGRYLPSNLREIGSLLDADASPTPHVETISFGGPGLASYGPVCEVEFLAP